MSCRLKIRPAVRWSQHLLDERCCCQRFQGRQRWQVPALKFSPMKKGKQQKGGDGGVAQDEED